MNRFMFDKDFLKKLDNYQHKEKYARITALTLDEKPVESIEGKITGGSINIDGASSLRRTSTLTLLAYNTKVTDYYWGLQNKYKLEIGLKNNININYPDIIWFKMGVYSITSFSTSISGGSYNISISGKDKMCLLNGELGGVFPFSVDLGKEEISSKITNSDGSIDKIITIKDLTLPYIIKEMIHNYGGEPYHNIIINDMDENGLELMEYRGQNPMYIIKVAKNPDAQTASLEGNQTCYVNGEQTTFAKIAELQEMNGQTYEFTETPEDDKTYTLQRYMTGDTVGYRITDLVYTGDLIVNVGETITSVLDKFVNMLGDYEYFYDLEGRFIFQKKKTYIQSAWSPIIQDHRGINDFYVDPASEASKFSYSFDNNYLITAISNQPKLDNIKNDFSIWGTKKSVTGQELDVHLRYAIHSKPTKYTSISVDQSEVNSFINKYPEFKDMKGQESKTYQIGEKYDYNKGVVTEWQDIIYYMAQDYNKFSHFDNFEEKVANANPDIYPLGRTGYEQYYIDILGFWRGLYYPTIEQEIYNTYSDKYQDLIPKWKKLTNRDYKDFDTNYNKAKEQQINFEISISNILSIEENKRSKDQEIQLDQFQLYLDYEEEIDKAKTNYYLDSTDTSKLYGWNRNIQYPETLDFWIDFLDPAGDLEKYSINAIGSRPKANTDKDVKGIYFREAPQVIYYYPEESAQVLTNKKSGYAYIQFLPSMADLMSLSAQGKSAKDTLDKWLNNYLYGAETISIAGIPIYYLEPNTRIKVSNNDVNLSGEYIITKISLPLTFNGTMNISAYKTIPMLY